jgi:hypothetical protein
VTADKTAFVTFDTNRYSVQREASQTVKLLERAVVITTNLAYKQWGTVFGDSPCLVARQGAARKESRHHLSEQDR